LVLQGYKVLTDRQVQAVLFLDLLAQLVLLARQVGRLGTPALLVQLVCREDQLVLKDQWDQLVILDHPAGLKMCILPDSQHLEPGLLQQVLLLRSLQ
jgi:hypothetical protein